MSFLFVLGRQPELSLAEIIACLKRLGLNYQINLFQREILLLSVKEKLDAVFLMNQLGGVVKIAEVITPSPLTETQLENTLLKVLANRFGNNKDEKKIFGLSFYGNEREARSREQIGMRIKKALKDEGRIVRFVTSREPTLSAVVVKTNKLLTEKGAEIIIFAHEKKIWLAKTLAVQPFAEFSERDYGRPGRDAISGMLPPKLAKILINLAEINTNAVILDPFCGSGTILTEAALMGYQNIFGSDISPKAVADTKQNIAWIIQKLKIIPNKSGQKSEIKQCDARFLSRYFPPAFFDAIITEPYLGPPLKGRETPEQINNIIRELSSLYLASLKEIHKILKPDGRVVMIWPVFNKNKFLPLENEIKKLGFKIEPLLPPNFAHLLTPRGTLIYARPEQRVGREIVKLRLID